jgi:hypothetical protein
MVNHLYDDKGFYDGDDTTAAAESARARIAYRDALGECWKQRMTAAHDPLRRTGRSTRQMEAAPLNAFYVIPYSGGMDYFKRLRDRTQRLDLDLRSVDDTCHTFFYRGTDRIIVVDHTAADIMDDETRACVAAHNIFVDVRRGRSAKTP